MTAAKLPTVLGIRPEAIPAWLSLADALDRMTDDRRRPVCQSNPGRWSDGATKAVRQEAIEACGWCPVIGPCGRFAEANQERAGVWGGIDRAARPKATPRKRAAA